MHSKATLKVILDPDEKSEKRLLKLRVTYERKPHLYSLNTSQKITAAEFSNTKLKVYKDAMAEAKKAYDIATAIVDKFGKDFSFEKFKRIYREELYGVKRDYKTFADVTEAYIDKLDVHSTKQNYQTSANWIEKVRPGVKLEAIDEEFVDSLVKQMKDEGLSENSIRIYCRQLKAIYQNAITTGLVKGTNPFSRYAKHSIGRSLCGLTEEELATFLQYVARTQLEEFGQDFFALSLACSGANIGDLLSLKNENIRGDRISLIRRKTKKNPIPIVIPLIDPAVNIFNKYGCIDLEKPDYLILPFLSDCKDDISIRNKIHDVIKRINKGLAQVCEGTGLRKITTYDARHTYATLARDKGLSVSQLQKMMGHASSKTTSVYLGKLSESVIERGKEALNEVFEKGSGSGETSLEDEINSLYEKFGEEEVLKLLAAKKK